MNFAQYQSIFGIRETWLCNAVTALAPIFWELNYTLPPVRASIGWTSRGAGDCLAECWPRDASTIGVNEIFVVPTLDNPVRILDLLIHEIIHAIDDCEHGHGPQFRRIALKVGLKGPMPSTQAGASLKRRLKGIADELGPIPHQRIKFRRW